MRLSLVLASLLVCVSSAFAQAPYLVKDLGNGSTGPQHSDPSAFLSSGGTLFFVATTEAAGQEPWVRDANGTRLLRDINPGTAASNVVRFVEFTPGVVVFVANDGLNGLQLWRSNGTTAGTTLVKVLAGPGTSFVPSIAFGGKVYFAADDGVHGREPWVTDGTAEGTQMLADTHPSAAGNTLIQFFRLGDTMRFFAPGGIWITDGTPAGTARDITLAGYRLPCAVAGNTVYFFAFDNEHGYEPWKSDGTQAGTMLLKDVRPGTTSSILSTASIAPAGNAVVFFADDGAGGRLWTSDGTTANTTIVAAFPAPGTANFTSFLYPTSKGVFFNANANSAVNVWRTDGTEAGTYIATTAPFNPGPFVEAFNNIFFAAWTATSTGQHLFRIDGSQGSAKVEVRDDVTLGTNLTFTGGKLWFTGNDGTNGRELWTSDDGTRDGTYLAANIAVEPARSSNLRYFAGMGPHLYFLGAWPENIWRSDGSSGGTVELTTIDSRQSPGFAALTPYRGSLYFKFGHHDLYRLGANGGQTLIGSFDFDWMDADENYIYLWSYSFSGLRRSDGTAEGTIRLYDPLEPSDTRWDNLYVALMRGSAWAFAGRAVYRSEGTIETTRRVLTLPSDGYVSFPHVPAGGFIFARRWDFATGMELWRTDGTPAGTGVLKDIHPGQVSSEPDSLTAAGPILYFTATDPEHGTELWRSDGTEAGTWMVKDIRPGVASSMPSSLAVMNGVLYFAANDGTHGIELWKSDGTEAGTVMVRDIVAGAFPSQPSHMTGAGGRIWFTANDGLHGMELWSSDGTADGTAMVSDIFIGSASSLPQDFKAVESSLFFTAATEETGRELWVMPLTSGYLTIADASVTEGNSGSTMRFMVKRHGVATGAASVAWSTEALTATAGTDFTASSGTLYFGAGETVKGIDVLVNGDTLTEQPERLAVRLASPAGVALQNASAVGTIEDDDPRADLAIEIEPLVNSSDESYRAIKVTNHGPSPAYAVTVDFTESPYEFRIQSASPDVTCTNANPSRCTLPFIQAGASKTFHISRWPVEGIVDPALPPGRTLAANVSSSIVDADLSNNTASRMTTGSGNLLLPPFLVAGENATATYVLSQNATSAIDVTLTSSSGNVTITPATARIEAGQRTATFTLAVTAGAASTLLTATIGGQTTGALVMPIVASGQTPKLDVAIVQEVSYIQSGALMIPVRVAARLPDATVPTGIVTLLDQNGATLAQLALDAKPEAIFARQGLAPGDHHFRLRYEGDARFNPVTVALNPTTVAKTRPTMTVKAPISTCVETFDVRITVAGQNPYFAPAGSVQFRFDNLEMLGPYTLVPTGVPGQAAVSLTFTKPYGFRSGIEAFYSGDGNFYDERAYGSVSVGCSSMNVVATATSPTSVTVTWTPPATPVSYYTVFRSESADSPFNYPNHSTTTTFVDNNLTPGRIYLYRVIATGPASSQPSYPEIASTFTYTDDPLAPGTLIKSAHLSQLRTMIATLRQVAGLPPLAFTGSVARGSTMDALHVTELRASIDAARAKIGLPAIHWTQPNAAPQSIIRASTLQELREAVK